MDDRDLRNIASAKRMYTGEAAEYSTISPDIVWHVPGHNPVSGEYRGLAAYTQDMPARMAPLTRWEFEVVSVMANGDYVMATFMFAGERNGVVIESQGGHLMRFDDEGRVVEGWGFVADQDALDLFFSARG